MREHSDCKFEDFLKNAQSNLMTAKYFSKIESTQIVKDRLKKAADAHKEADDYADADLPSVSIIYTQIQEHVIAKDWEGVATHIAVWEGLIEGLILRHKREHEEGDRLEAALNSRLFFWQPPATKYPN